MEIYFIRHGQTLFNLMDKMQGWSDTPLTKQGIDDLKKTGKYLENVHFDALYSSDLKRAIDTANIIKKENKVSSLDLRISQNFREISFGSLEGLNSTELWKKLAKPYGFTNQIDFAKKYSMEFTRSVMKKADPWGYAEDYNDLLVRFNNGLNKLRKENANDSRILVVTHGTLIETIILEYFKPKVDVTQSFPENGSITKALLTNDTFKVVEYNILPK
ncbi:histidine phosphatase family protein [Companilactobacillus jidongensis]|uniref:histidine phosphatase family protein n=1 Tax=Companilactobacillus jidongensis TaxID=2486006 RepID=UPI000F79A72A|nr:histidine phosphatase family protein [Companilactobacillus jidongensis]